MQRAATSVFFGFDFQTNAAIVLMLENMEEMETIRVEGEEDIQIKLNDGTYVLAQAKSVVNASSDFDHVRSKAKKALESLSDAAQKLSARELIYITNSPDPLKDDASRHLFYADAHVKFSNLPDSTKDLINGWLQGDEIQLDTSKFKIQVLPFETDDDRQKYKVVLQDISDFIGSIGINYDGLRKDLHEVWTSSLYRNGSKSDQSITLHKKAIIWPIIVYVTSRGRLDRDSLFLDVLDESEYEEITQRYGEVIDSYCERFDFMTKVITDFMSSGVKGKEAITAFINQRWEEYRNEIGDESLDNDIRCNLVKIILYNIISKRFDINRIKKAVNL